MGATTTIFRFVTVRNPRKATEDEIDTGFVYYDDKIGAQVMTDVAEHGRAAHGEGNARERRTRRRNAMRGVLRKFRDSKDYLRTVSDAQSKAGALIAFGEYLARNNTTVTKADIEKYLHDHDVKVDLETMRLLWNNLLTYTFVGGISETREAIIGAIRAAKVVTFDKHALTDAVARRLALATVVLPSAVQINGDHLERRTPNERPPHEDKKKRVLTVKQRLADYETAYNELVAHRDNELEKERAKPVRPLQMPKVDGTGCLHPPPGHDESDAAEVPRGTLVDEHALRSVSNTTRGVLESLRIQPGSRIAYAIKRIADTAASDGRKLWEGVSPSTKVVAAGGSLWTYEPTDATHDHRRPMPDGDNPELDRGNRIDVEYAGMYDTDECRIKPLGIADFRRVEQEIWCYEPGEVAHIENIMIGETRERVTRFLRRTENIFTTETEEEVTKERDTQTTDRFEIEKETEKIVKEDISFDLGVQVTAQYGVVKIQADTNFAYAQSTSESDKASSKYAKEITDRAKERVVKRVREEQIKKVLEEFEETNKHGYTNANGNAHIVGLYRWVDKIYQAKIVNYGKRLMFEFLVPEPAAFHLYAMTKSAIENTLPMEKPIDPRSDEALTVLNLQPLGSHLDINVSNYALWAAAFGVKVDPIPEPTLTISKAYSRDGMDHTIQFSDAKTDFKVTDGYEASSFYATYGLHSEDHDGGPNWITVVIGRNSRFTTSGGSFSGSLSGEDDFIPINIMGRTRMYGLNVEVNLTRKQQTYEAWQVKTFGAIIKGYEDKLGAYLTALAEAKAKAESIIKGTNPLLNRQIEQMELKKACIRMMDIDCEPLASEAMKDHQDCDYPEFDCCEAMRDKNYVQFVEQAFEWNLMTYLFYPYFWGRKCNWKKIYQLEDTDPLFLAFLQAGFARVVVPVREGYNDAALRWLVDNQPWNGGSAPGVDSDMYLSIVNEMKEPVGEIDLSVEPWPIRVPTTLTVLQAESGAAPGQGLPCPGHEDDHDA